MKLYKSSCSVILCCMLAASLLRSVDFSQNKQADNAQTRIATLEYKLACISGITVGLVGVLIFYEDPRGDYFFFTYIMSGLLLAARGLQRQGGKK